MSLHLQTRRRDIQTPTDERAAKLAYRPEVQGLRALAVLMVVTYHVWFGKVSGGVDVFLLISAFLLALSFMRRVESGRPLDLVHYWLHLFKRLLPAAAVVMVAVLAATFVLLPASLWHDILEQAWASLFYVQNWLLAANSVDYYAADQSLTSPLQHFWSLSIQGQVFILWPLLFAGSALVARAVRVRFRLVVLLVFGALFLASLGFSIVETYTNQAQAYFDSRTRLWEFALGTLLALALPYVRLPRAVRVAAGWIGLIAMLSGGFLLDVEREFPGYVALWPLLAAAFVILAGQTGSRAGADRLLSWKPLVRMGDMSYALYLWHWPILVIYLIARDQPAAGPRGGAAIIALSLLLAYLTTRFVEHPIRQSVWAERRRRRAGLVIVACLALVAIPLTAWQQGLRIEAERLEAQTIADNPGARVLMDGFVGDPSPDAPPVPAAAEIQGEWAALSSRCNAAPYTPDDPVVGEHCSDNTPEGEPTRTLVVVGDSHAEQWLGSIEPLAEERGWKVVALLKGECAFGQESDTRSAECNDYNNAADRYIKDLQPDAVFAVATAAHPDEGQDLVVPGFAGAAAELMDRGIHVVGIRDNPRYSFDMMACIGTHGEEAGQCRPPKSQALNDTPPFGELRNAAPGIGLMDMTDMLCPVDVCPPVIGNIHVYIDDNHLTETYVESMLAEFAPRFESASGW